MSELINFIKQNKNWKEILSSDPYNIIFDETDNFILLKYSQIKSNFKNSIVKECRGCIIDKNTLEFACRPFNKFFNYGDSNADIIDWKSAKVQEKCDGSLIKLWWNKYEEKWHWSTMGKINITEATLNQDVNKNYKNFFDILMSALKKYNFSKYFLNKNFTYMFELTSPYNRVVVPHKEINIKHLATRNNKHGREINVYIGIPRPKEFTFVSIEDILENIKELSFDNEGYVVVDKIFNRVKIKGLAYLTVHKLKANGVLNNEKILDLIKINEHKEFLNYFLEYKESFDLIEKKYNNFIDQIEDDFKKSDILKEDKKYGSKKHRKLFAEFAKKCIYPGILFEYYNNKIGKNDVKKYLANLDSKKILKYLKISLDKKIYLC